MRYLGYLCINVFVLCFMLIVHVGGGGVMVSSGGFFPVLGRFCNLGLGTGVA